MQGSPKSEPEYPTLEQVDHHRRAFLAQCGVGLASLATVALVPGLLGYLGGERLDDGDKAKKKPPKKKPPKKPKGKKPKKPRRPPQPIPGGPRHPPAKLDPVPRKKPKTNI